MSQQTLLRIFCDFDGTIAVNDVGNELFTRFGDPKNWWRLVSLWQQGKIDGRELWQRQCRESWVTPVQLDAFAASQPIDPGFVQFRRFCRDQDFPVYVVSDGMDAYIERILHRHGIDEITLRCNHLEVDETGRLTVTFPYYEQSCGQCANCKGSHLSREKQPGEKTVYIGDGLSDLCALGVADLLFAKKELEMYCKQKGVPFIEYTNFFDVQKALQKIMA